MATFWDNSWHQLDMTRLSRYLDSFDFEVDRIIEQLRAKNVHTVCDAGCGCGIYTLKLLSHGFAVNGFDISLDAVRIASRLIENAQYSADLKTASILSTGYRTDQFDAVVSRDVIDHMTLKDGIAAVAELCRITKPGGDIFITLDCLDSEYLTEPHSVTCDGDYIFTEGKWKGMVFHPYTQMEIQQIVPPGAACAVACEESGMTVKLTKPERNQLHRIP